MAERTCIVHIGTHKTGTTSQQYFLMQHAQRFADEGLLFPKSGWYGVVPGHHGVAWELLDRSDGPIFSALLEEMNAFKGHAAIISAEDFSLFASRRDALENLCSGLRSIGYTPKILVYFRAQAQFAESMYVERAKHGLVEPVSQFVNDVVETGHYQPAGALLPIEIRYSRMLSAFDSIFGRENIQVGIYEGREDLARVFNDFLVTVLRMAGIPESKQISLEVTHPIVNESLSFIHLLGTVFAYTHPGENIAATAHVFAAEFAPDLPKEYMGQRFALLRREDYLAILKSVVEDNLAVLRDYGARVPFLSDQDIPGSSAAIWAKAHIERKIFDRCLREWLKEQSNADGS